MLASFFKTLNILFDVIPAILYFYSSSLKCIFNALRYIWNLLSSFISAVNFYLVVYLVAYPLLRLFITFILVIILQFFFLQHFVNAESIPSSDLSSKEDSSTTSTATSSSSPAADSSEWTLEDVIVIAVFVFLVVTVLYYFDTRGGSGSRPPSPSSSSGSSSSGSDFSGSESESLINFTDNISESTIEVTLLPISTEAVFAVGALYQYIRAKLKFQLRRVQAVIITVTLCFYGLALGIWRKVVYMSGNSIYLIDDYYLWLIQGTLAAAFPRVMPFVFFGMYTFAYRVELFFNILNSNRDLRKQVISYIQQMRKSRIGFTNFIGRVGSFGFMGGSPKTPGGNPYGMLIWGAVVITAVSVNEYRLHLRDKLRYENERLHNAASAQNEHLRDTASAQNERFRDEQRARTEAYKARTEAYKAHADAVNKRPWFGSKPPEPPKM